MRIVSVVLALVCMSSVAYAQNVNNVIIEQPVIERVVSGPEAYQSSGRPRMPPPGVIPPVGPAYFPGFIVGPAPWQPMMPMW